MTDYGTDIAMTADLRGLDPAFGSVTGRRCLAEALVRRLQTPPGRLIDDPDYGYDLIGEINDDLGPADAGRIAVEVTNEVQKDERVVSASTTASFALGVLTVSIEITDGAGPFRLVLAVTAVSATVLQVTP